MHAIICGRSRKNIKVIESSTNTAIYFPPPFTQVYRYCPEGANRRNPDQIFITGETDEDIIAAKMKIHEIVQRTRIFHKDANITSSKIDSIILGRLDKARKIMEMNGTYILFPALASPEGRVRIQGVEGLHVERSVRDVMNLVGQSDGFLSFVNVTSLVNSTVRPGGFRAARTVRFPLLSRPGRCFPTSAPTRVRMSHSTR